MVSVRLERVRRECNELRFYELHVDQDFFGRWVLQRCWGRLGTDGQRRSRDYGSRDEALVALRGLPGDNYLERSASIILSG